jgi:hypothetical protein
VGEKKARQEDQKGLKTSDPPIFCILFLGVSMEDQAMESWNSQSGGDAYFA